MSLHQYCVEPGCSWTATWEGGSAANDPAIKHLKSNPDHTVRSGGHEGHRNIEQEQAAGKIDATPEIEPEDWK